MIYDFVYDIIKMDSRDERKKAVRALDDKQAEILEHIYFNKQMPPKEDMREYIDRGFSRAQGLDLLEIVRVAKDPEYNQAKLTREILQYLYNVSLMYGNNEARRASKVIFCEQKICLTAKEVKEELGRRQR